MLCLIKSKGLSELMKNILLIGDSIRMGYDKAVKKSFEGIANVVFPEDNCRFASYVLRYFHEYTALINEGNIDVIHWNAGLWDCLHMFGEEAHTPIDIYSYYIERTCQRMKKLCPYANIIFATSTSVITEKMDDKFKRFNEEIEKYNAVASEIVKKYDIRINDLYSLSKTLPPEAHSDAVHYYTSSGTQAFTDRVITSIAEFLNLEKIPTYSEVLYTDKPIGM